MKRILILLASLLFVGESFALPSCSVTGYVASCFATYSDAQLEYVGEFKNSTYHGHGVMSFRSGNKYVGEFKNGTFNGQGTYTSHEGTKYVGEFKNGKRNGQGTKTWPDGDKYVGEYKDGKKNGQGTYTYHDGVVYVGEWKYDERTFFVSSFLPELRLIFEPTKN